MAVLHHDNHINYLFYLFFLHLTHLLDIRAYFNVKKTAFEVDTSVLYSYADTIYLFPLKKLFTSL